MKVLLFYTDVRITEIDVICKLKGFPLKERKSYIGGYYIVTDGFYKGATVPSAVNIFGSQSVFYRQSKKERYTFTVCNSLNKFLEKLAEYD